MAKYDDTLKLESSLVMAERDRLANRVGEYKSRRSLIRTIGCFLGVMSGVFFFDYTNDRRDEAEFYGGQFKAKFERDYNEKAEQFKDSKGYVPTHVTPRDEKLMDEIREMNVPSLKPKEEPNYSEIPRSSAEPQKPSNESEKPSNQPRRIPVIKQRFPDGRWTLVERAESFV